MSTLAKLDKTVRLDRMLRKHVLGHLRHEVNNTRAPLEARATAALVLAQLTKICRDPRRTGAAKDRIFLKLGAAGL